MPSGGIISRVTRGTRPHTSHSHHLVSTPPAHCSCIPWPLRKFIVSESWYIVVVIWVVEDENNMTWWCDWVTILDNYVVVVWKVLGERSSWILIEFGFGFWVLFHFKSGQILWILKDFEFGQILAGILNWGAFSVVGVPKFKNTSHLRFPRRFRWT